MVEIDERELEARVGEVRVEVRLENFGDRYRANLGEIPEDQVRSATVRLLADTGARMLVLPDDIVQDLGLQERRRVVVTYADGRQEERPVAAAVIIRVGNRSAVVECIVSAPGTQPFLGQVELELMDLLVDCTNQRLVPRPESPYLPLVPLM